MVLRRHFAYVAYAALAACPALVMAQSVEPEWRVVNVEPAQVVPLVESPANPFPQVKEEVKEVVPQNTFEDEQEKARRAQLDGLKQFVEGAPLVGPDMGSIRVGGYMVGPRGGSALMNGKWMKVGDSFKVSTRARPEATSTLQLLKSMRDGEADAMVERLESRMANPAPVTLKITGINEKQVDVSDGKVSYPLLIPRQRGF